MKSQSVGKVCQENGQRAVQTALKIFLNNPALYVEIVTSHKLFFDIFFMLRENFQNKQALTN
jgi:hypothetical protein